MINCAICDRINLLENVSSSGIVCEFPHSWLLLGDHQYFRGYCVLFYKHHVRELHELDSIVYHELMDELRTATMAIAKAFHPWKINHASLGNQDQHIHWHIIPRYESETDRSQHPWLHSAEFNLYQVSDQERQSIAATIRKFLT